MKNEKEIEVAGLTKKFGDITAVDRITFDVKKGEIFGFLGPNGAGKSTTVRMLCGILPPTSGNAWVHGIDVIKKPEEVKKNIGYMSQKFGLYVDLTVRENLNFYGRIYSDKWNEVKERVEFVMEYLGLKRYSDLTASKLSGGWRQRLAFACAIIHDPPVLFLDEPTAGVDPVSRRFFWDILYEVAEKGRTIFVTTHYMEEAERCSKIGLMWNGKLVALGSPDEIKKNVIKNRVYTLKGDIEKIKDKIAKLQWVEEVSQYGNELHIITSSLKDVKERIKETAEEYGEFISVDESVPSIEDVFAYLSKRQG
jgi:ABC-2 type transport system ATP-binding protein